MTDPETKHLQDFQSILDMRFQNPQLLRRALTHRSFVNESEDVIRDNERLEFLGDAVLDFIVADMLFRRFPDVTEGELTQLRSALVRTDSLAMLASECHLGEYLFMGKGEANSGGRDRLNNLCRGLEAVIGAMYIDSGVQAVRAFILPRFERLLAYILEHSLHKDARSMLQERSQAELRFTPVYRLVDSAGPDHEKEFFVEVIVGEDVILGSGTGHSKRAAAQAAARTALQSLEADGWPPPVEELFEQLMIQSETDSDTLEPPNSASSPDEAGRTDTDTAETITGTESTTSDKQEQDAVNADSTRRRKPRKSSKSGSSRRRKS